MTVATERYFNTLILAPIFNDSPKPIFSALSTQRENKAAPLSIFETVERAEERLREQALSERVLDSTWMCGRGEEA